MKSKTLLTSFASALIALTATDAWACGGCFSPPTTDTTQTVVQNAERVLFFRDDATKKSYVWIEVVYAGLAKDFGWVLPLPKQPKVGVGTKFVFDALDARLGFRVALQSAAAENCRDPYSGCEAQAKTSADAAASVDFGSAGARAEDISIPPPVVPGVEVLDSGSTGPYNYAVIKGSDADGLHKWLTLAGYATPEKAKPIIQLHATKGDVFVAIKLQNGQGVNAIRPVTLEMDDAEPCVPLRLTSIAAQDDMTITVTVAGNGRAVVKNYFDVVINPLRLTLLDPQTPVPCLGAAKTGATCHIPKNYAQVLAAAIDEAGGHAFVTEASLAGQNIGKLSPLQDFDVAQLGNVATLYQFAQFLAASKMPLESEIMEALQSAFMAAGPIFMTATQAEVFGALKACGSYWSKAGAQDDCVVKGLTLSKAKLQAIAVSGQPLAKSFKEGIIDPLFLVSNFMAKTPRTTRLVMRISAQEMDRDPVFAFSPTLPEVKPDLDVQFNSVCIDGWNNGELRTRMTLPTLGTWLVGSTSIIDPLFAPTPAAMVVLVQEESGAPIPIATGDLGVVDAAIVRAKPGAPSIPKGLVLKPFSAWTPPPVAKPVTVVGKWKMPPSCTPKKGWIDGQLPPSGQTPDASSGSDGSPDAGSGTDALVNLDGGSTTGTTGTTAATTSKGSSSGCRAAPSSGGWVGLLMLVFAAGWLWRRRPSC